MINLDTHMLIYALTGALRPAEKELLSANAWSICAIVWWELAKLNQLGRIHLEIEDRKLQRALRTVHTWPLSAQVAVQSTRMDFESDPADELIAATSVVHDAPLLTRDRALLKSKITPLALP